MLKNKNKSQCKGRQSKGNMEKSRKINKKLGGRNQNLIGDCGFIQRDLAHNLQYKNFNVCYS